MVIILCTCTQSMAGHADICKGCPGRELCQSQGRLYNKVKPLYLPDTLGWSRGVPLYTKVSSYEGIGVEKVPL